MTSEISGNLLITGGLGYLGGRIANYLAAEASQLSLRLMTHRDKDCAPDWARHQDLIHADLLDYESLQSAVEGIDAVLHLAALDEAESQRDPDLALDVNGKGTHRLLQACQNQGVKRFIYMSTFHVYGPAAPQPITEQTPPRPIHPYAITHRLAEDFVNWYKHTSEMETLVLRLSNGYGYPSDPHVQRWNLVFNDLCKQAVQKKEIRLRSQGTQQRDFVSITDISRGIHHFLGLPSGAWEDGLFNFGGECSMSILQVAQYVASEYSPRYGEKIPVITGEAEDPHAARPVNFSIEKLRKTGFSPVGNMAEEVRRTFDICAELTPQSEGAQ